MTSNSKERQRVLLVITHLFSKLPETPKSYLESPKNSPLKTGRASIPVFPNTLKKPLLAF